MYYSQLRQCLKEGKIQRNIAKKYIDKLKQLEVEKCKQRKVEKLKDITSKLRENNKFNQEGFWSLKRVMKEGKIAPASVVENGIEYFEKESINELYREEFQQRLKPNSTEENFKVFEKLTEIYVSMCLEHSKEIKSHGPFTLEEV